MRITSLRRPALGVLALSCSVACLPDAAEADAATELDRMLITAQGRDEPRARAAGTVQVIDTATIRRSSARSVTDLLAENAVGFFSDWSPGQTSFNIRGGATDGQGRDWRSQVTVLMNGRRAGTANLSKLSPDDLDRIEIIRGPASVIYGAQAIGGVVNLVTRSGATEDPGSEITARAGSFGLARGHAANAGGTAGFDHYVGIGGGLSDDYHTPEGQLANTAWKRGGGLAALGFESEDVGRIDLTLRTDGVYDAGFRGSQWDLDNTDDRRNASLDLAWDTEFGGGLGLSAQAYAVRDVDSFHWGSERQRSGAPGFSVDDNRRQLDVLGLKLAPRLAVGDDTDLLFGIDAETGDRLARHLSRVSRYIETADVDLGDVVEDRRALEAEIGRLIDEGLSPRPAALALRVQRMASELERTQLMRLMLLMMAAGVETPLSAIANALAVLLDHRHLIDRLAVEPSLADSFALEVMRFQPPQHDTTRFVRGHTMLGGIEVRRGTSVRVFLASANRDESVFQAADRFDPERFLPGRPPVPVLSFGAGRHACPGRPLASAIIAEALRRLAGGFQDIRPAEDCDPTITGEGFRRPQRLTLVLDPRRRPATASLPGAAVA
ncbi:MAG TPA: hypothetical protein DCK97_14410 [Tistrella mobilis]|uniref:TonB-dependent receptor plug domain-containing protein n=1 Tax=Tistrella mobilis TaxID=171437 RepID=A0A3B9IMR1_9PROT|nr:hypothetical protein [Tistrella mobilis]